MTFLKIRTIMTLIVEIQSQLKLLTTTTAYDMRN